MESQNTQINLDNFIQINNHTLINKNMIRWIKKYEECFYISTRNDGCSLYNAHTLCKDTNPILYQQFTSYFKELKDNF